MAQHPQHLQVYFAHPSQSDVFTAEVAAHCTAQQAIQGLLDTAFLMPAPPGRPYGLIVRRTRKQITPNMTLAQAGVMDGEEIEVRQDWPGA